MTQKIIAGAGGGGGGKGGSGSSATHVATEARDSMRSTAYAQVIDLVSEGEIEGLVDGMKSIYLNDTPIQNPDGSYNFSGISVDTRPGTQSQSYIAGFPAVENEISVQLQVKTTTPIVKTVTNQNVNAVRVTVAIPALSYQDPSTGDINPTSVQYKIQVQTNGGGYVDATDTITVSGKTSGRYERAHRIPVGGTGPWDIKLVRLTADSTQTNLQNQTWWSSYTEIIDAKLRYPNSALVALRIDASQFQSIPSRSYDLKLLRIPVPTNYDPIARTYSGVWDGTFKMAWTDNPAWCFCDLLLTDRYGLGRFIQSDNVDKWALYQIARYCDELVPNGYGGFEPRFTCNVYIQSRQDAYKVLQDFASCFRAMTYWASNAITCVQDSPTDATQLYTTANVVDGMFQYQGTSSKARHTVALVRWNDPDDMYRQKVEYVEDREGIARYGYIQTDVVGFGCTSRGQANRVGRWLLYSERLETDSVTFKVGLEGAVSRPGQVIKIADSQRAGSRQGGRVTSATTTSITVDSAPTGAYGGSLSVVLDDGSVQTSTVVGGNGLVLNVSPAFTTAPAAGAIWVLSTSTIEAQTFRVVSIAELEGSIYEISAIAHEPNKYAAIENNLVLEPRSYSILTDPPPAPEHVTIEESLYQSSSEVRTRVTFSWTSVSYADSYSVSYSIDGGNYINLPTTTINSVDLNDAQPGKYTVKVYSLSTIGRRSVSPGLATAQVFGKTAPPADVANFSLIPMAGQAMLTWDLPTDLDVFVGGYARIRYTPRTTGQTWNDAVDVVPALPGSTQTAVAPLMNGTYMAKFVDSSGNQSVGVSQIVTTVPDLVGLNAIVTYNESATFGGVKNGVVVGANGLQLDSALTIDAWTGLIDTLPLIDYPGGVGASGVYYFENTLDLGATYPTKFTAKIQTIGLAIGSIIDSRTDELDLWLDIDGNKLDAANAEIFMRTTLDNPSGTPTWSDWKPFFVGEYTARAFQFKVEMTSQDTNNNLGIQTLQVAADMPDRVESVYGQVSGTTTYHVTYNNAFRASPAVGITANAMASGDYYEITNKTAAGFDIIFKNSAGTAVSRTFDVIAKGYGRLIT